MSRPVLLTYLVYGDNYLSQLLLQLKTLLQVTPNAPELYHILLITYEQNRQRIEDDVVKYDVIHKQCGNEKSLAGLDSTFKELLTKDK